MVLEARFHANVNRCWGLDPLAEFSGKVFTHLAEGGDPLSKGTTPKANALSLCKDFLRSRNDH